MGDWLRGIWIYIYIYILDGLDGYIDIVEMSWVGISSFTNTGYLGICVMGLGVYVYTLVVCNARCNGCAAFLLVQGEPNNMINNYSLLWQHAFTGGRSIYVGM